MLVLAKTISDLRFDEFIEGRSSRNKSKQQNTVNFLLMANIHSVFELQRYSQAKGILETEKAIEAEHQSPLKNNTWVLFDLPPGKKPISYKWVYKVQYNADKTLDKCKARLVAMGFSQKEGIYYEETFALIAKMSTIRLVPALATQFGWKVHQMDVKSAFLNGELQEECIPLHDATFRVQGCWKRTLGVQTGESPLWPETGSSGLVHQD